MKNQRIAIVTLCLLFSALFWPIATVGAQSNSWISGTVTESTPGKGAPIPGVIVTVVGKSVTATTDAKGKFNISISPGTYLLEFTKTNYISPPNDDVTVMAGMTTYVTLTMSKEPAKIHLLVTVTKSKGQPLSGATVSIESILFGSKVLNTDAKGEANFTDLEKSKYNVTVTLSGYEKYVAPSLIDMSTGSKEITVPLKSQNKAQNLFGFGGLTMVLVLILPIIMIIIIILGVWFLMRRKKKTQQTQQSVVMQPAMTPGAAAPPPQQPQTYEQLYGSPPPQQGSYQSPSTVGQQYQGYAQPPTPPGQQPPP